LMDPLELIPPSLFHLARSSVSNLLWKVSGVGFLFIRLFCTRVLSPHLFLSCARLYCGGFKSNLSTPHLPGPWFFAPSPPLPQEFGLSPFPRHVGWLIHSIGCFFRIAAAVRELSELFILFSAVTPTGAFLLSLFLAGLVRTQYCS